MLCYIIYLSTVSGLSFYPRRDMLTFHFFTHQMKWSHEGPDGIYLYKLLIKNPELTLKQTPQNNKQLIEKWSKRVIRDNIGRQKKMSAEIQHQGT